MNLHKMMNCQYEPMFFENYFNLTDFDSKLSYYKIFLRDSLDDPKQMEYELENTYSKPIEYNVDKMI